MDIGARPAYRSDLRSTTSKSIKKLSLNTLGTELYISCWSRRFAVMRSPLRPTCSGFCEQYRIAVLVLLVPLRPHNWQQGDIFVSEQREELAPQLDGMIARSPLEPRAISGVRIKGTAGALSLLSTWIPPVCLLRQGRCWPPG